MIIVSLTILISILSGVSLRLHLKIAILIDLGLDRLVGLDLLPNLEIILGEPSHDLLGPSHHGSGLSHGRWVWSLRWEVDLELSSTVDGVENNADVQIDTGATVPFVARYRKEQTGGLDEVVA